MFGEEIFTIEKHYYIQLKINLTQVPCQEHLCVEQIGTSVLKNHVRDSVWEVCGNSLRLCLRGHLHRWGVWSSELVWSPGEKSPGCGTVQPQRSVRDGDREVSYMSVMLTELCPIRTLKSNAHRNWGVYPKLL